MSDTFEGGAATVAVIERQCRISGRYMVMNNTYILDVNYNHDYVGNLDAASFSDHPVNTDDRLIIEYRAPIVNQNASARLTSYFTGANQIRYLVQNSQAFPYEEAFYLAELPSNARKDSLTIN